MNPAEILDRIESGESVARVVGSSRPAGLGSAFFDRIAGYSGSDPQAALRLASNAPALKRVADDPGLVVRGQAVAARLKGKWNQAAKLFKLAGSLAPTPEMRLVYAIGGVDSLARSGHTDEALRLGRRLVRGLGKLGLDAQAGRVCLNLGNALVWADRYDEASRYFRRSLANLDESYEVERAACLVGLSTCQLFGGRPAQAERLAEQALVTLRDLGLHAHAEQAEISRAYANLLLGRADDAYLTLRNLRADVRDQTADSRLAELMGDAAYSLNLYEESLAAFAEARSLADTPLNRANAWYGEGIAAAGLGDLARAERALREAARRYGRVGNHPWRLASKLAIAKLGERSPRGLVAEARRIGSPYWLAEVLLEVASRDHDTRALDEAAAIIGRCRYMDKRWRVEAIRAQMTAEPLPAYRKMLRHILVDRLRARSTSARAGFLRDKEQPLRAFLEFLLRTGRHREALAVVSQTRAVALIDEILSGIEADPAFVAELERLRNSEEGGPNLPGARLVGTATDSRSSLRPWDRLLDRIAPIVVAAPDVTSLVETSRAVFAVDAGGSRELANLSELQSLLRWFHFEVQEPLLDRDADPSEALCLLDRIKSLFERLPAELISPDQVTWAVPWGALGKEVALSPSFRGLSVPLDRSRVLLARGRTADLPWASRELEAVASGFEQVTLVETAAEFREVLAGGEVPWFHFVGHARAQSDNPTFSALEFEDGPVFAVEIARSQVRVGVAVLSACDTGRVSTRMRHEPDGLARAFLARKARAVVASAWPFDDEAAFMFTSSLYASKPSELRDSVSQARNVCREWRKHPYFWASPTVFSGLGESSLYNEPHDP